MAISKFTEFCGGWQFSGWQLLQHRIERTVALAASPAEQALVTRMTDRFWVEYREDRDKILARGLDIAEMDAQLAASRARYTGPLFHGRFQIAESLVPAGTHYIVDHNLLDLLVRVNGPASPVARFSTIHAAEDRVRELMGINFKKTEKPMDGVGERQLKALRAARREAALTQAPDDTLQAAETAPLENESTPEPEPEPVAEPAPLEPAPPETVAEKPRRVRIKEPEPVAEKPRRVRIKEPEPAPVPEVKKKRTWVNRKPKPSMLFRELILKGGITDREIFAAVQKEFGTERVPDSRFSNVAWYRNELRKAGAALPPILRGPMPKPSVKPPAEKKPVAPVAPAKMAPKPAPKSAEPPKKAVPAPKPAKPAAITPPRPAELPAIVPAERARLQGLAAMVDKLRAELQALLTPMKLTPKPPKPVPNLKGRMVFNVPTTPPRRNRAA